MSTDLKTLMSQDKKALAQSVHSMGGKIKRFNKTMGNPARNLVEHGMDAITHGVGGFGLGWLIGRGQGKLDSDTTKTSEEKEFGPEFWGIPQDIAIAGGLVVAGAFGQKLLGKRLAPTVSSLGIGALAYVAGSYGEKMAYDRETGE